MSAVSPLPDVVIGGVRYVPATSAVAGVSDVLRVLAESWWGAGEREAVDPAQWRLLRIIVADEATTLPDAEWDGLTFDALAALLADALAGPQP